MLHCAHRGFTLLEIIVVVAILAVLAGISVPYYQDYVTDSRQSVLKQNVANLRKVLDDFKGDHGRGPFIGPVIRVKGDNYTCDWKTMEGELTGGVLPTKKLWEGGVKNRRNKYINTLPMLEDPSGGPVTISVATSSIYYKDFGAANTIFDVDNDHWFKDENLTGKYDAGDTIGSGTWAVDEVGDPADVFQMKFVDSAGNEW
jgi:prepilin-type N-terminal cleavage/methylation domain-containing protein